MFSRIIYLSIFCLSQLYVSCAEILPADKSIDIRHSVSELKEKKEEELIQLFNHFSDQYDVDQKLKTASVMVEKYPHYMQYIEGQLANELDDMIDWYLKDVLNQNHFLNTPLSLEGLVKDIVKEMSNNKESSKGNSLKSILRKIDQVPQFHQLILDAMLSITMHDQYLLNDYLSFLSVNNEAIQDQLFDQLLESFEKSDMSRNLSPVVWCLKTLFRDHKMYLQQYVDVYLRLYYTLKHKQEGVLLCLLWQHMDACESTEQFDFKEIVHQQIFDYWGVRGAFPISNQWNEFAQKTMQMVLAKEECSDESFLRIHKFLESAKRDQFATDLNVYELFDANFLLCIDGHIFLNEHFSLKDRVASLNRLRNLKLFGIGTLEIFKKQIDNEIQHSLLKKYASHLYALNTRLSPYDVCHHMRAIADLIAEYPDISWERLTPYCIYDQYSENDHPYYKTLKSTWSLSLQLSIDEESGLIFCFDKPKYRSSTDDLNFYVCTANNGYALWYVTFQSKQNSAYGVASQPYSCSYSEKNVYLNVSGTVDVFDKWTGELIKRLASTSKDEEIKTVYDNNAGACFLLTKEKDNFGVIGINTNNYSENLFKILLENKCIMMSALVLILFYMTLGIDVKN